MNAIRPFIAVAVLCAAYSQTAEAADWRAAWRALWDTQAPSAASQPVPAPDLGNGVYRATGYGAPPANTESPAQGRLMAVEAAFLDAQRKLATILAGARLEADSAATNHVQSSYRVRQEVATALQGVRVLATRVNDDGTAEVDVELVLDSAQAAQTFDSLDGYRIRRVTVDAELPQATRAIASATAPPPPPKRATREAPSVATPIDEATLPEVGIVPAEEPSAAMDTALQTEPVSVIPTVLAEAQREAPHSDRPKDDGVPERKEESTSKNESIPEKAPPAPATKSWSTEREAPSNTKPATESAPAVSVSVGEATVSSSRQTKAMVSAPSKSKGTVYTDLILDARGLDVDTTRRLRVTTPEGIQIYPFEGGVLAEYAPETEPRVIYVTNPEDAYRTPGFGGHPMVVKVRDAGEDGLVLSRKTLVQLASLAQSRLARGEGYVVVLMN